MREEYEDVLEEDGVWDSLTRHTARSFNEARVVFIDMMKTAYRTWDFEGDFKDLGEKFRALLEQEEGLHVDSIALDSGAPIHYQNFVVYRENQNPTKENPVLAQHYILFLGVGHDPSRRFKPEFDRKLALQGGLVVYKGKESMESTVKGAIQIAPEEVYEDKEIHAIYQQRALEGSLSSTKNVQDGPQTAEQLFSLGFSKEDNEFHKAKLDDIMQKGIRLVDGYVK